MPENQNPLCTFLQPWQDVSLPLRYPVYDRLGEQRVAELCLPAAKVVLCFHWEGQAEKEEGDLPFMWEQLEHVKLWLAVNDEPNDSFW